LSVGLLDKTLVDDVWVAKVFGVAKLLSLALLPIPILQAAHFYPPNYLSKDRPVRWHFGCRTEREQGAFLVKARITKSRSGPAMI
jgi:hypothetical protein